MVPNQVTFVHFQGGMLLNSLILKKYAANPTSMKNLRLVSGMMFRDAFLDPFLDLSFGIGYRNTVYHKS